MIDTRESLLGRLKIENAHDAWKEFYTLYWAVILRYARKLGLNRQESEEVLQETMVVLMRVLPNFTYNRDKGRFRNFLLTIVHRNSLSAMRQKARNSEVPWESDGQAETADPSGDRAAEEAAAEARWRETLTEEALRRVQNDARMNVRTYGVFEAYVLQRQPAEVVAQRFEISENAVYQIRNRLIRRLQREFAKLLKNSGANED